MTAREESQHPPPATAHAGVSASIQHLDLWSENLSFMHTATARMLECEKAGQGCKLDCSKRVGPCHT